MFEVKVCKNEQLEKEGMIHQQSLEAWKPYRVKANSERFIMPALRRGQAFPSRVKSTLIFNHQKANIQGQTSLEVKAREKAVSSQKKRQGAKVRSHVSSENPRMV